MPNKWLLNQAISFGPYSRKRPPFEFLDNTGMSLNVIRTPGIFRLAKQRGLILTVALGSMLFATLDFGCATITIASFCKAPANFRPKVFLKVTVDLVHVKSFRIEGPAPA